MRGFLGVLFYEVGGFGGDDSEDAFCICQFLVSSMRNIDVSTFQFLLSITVVNGVELVCGSLPYLPSVAGGRCFPTRMPVQHTCCIVYFAIYYNPAIVVFVMLLNLLSYELLFWCSRSLLRFVNLLRLGQLHPTPVFRSRLHWMLKKNRSNSIVLLGDLRLDSIPAIIHHAYDIPRRFPRLRVLEHIEAPNDDRLAADQMGDLNINMPV